MLEWIVCRVAIRARTGGAAGTGGARTKAVGTGAARTEAIGARAGTEAVRTRAGTLRGSFLDLSNFVEVITESIASLARDGRLHDI